MTSSNSESFQYPLLQSLLEQKGLRLLGIYSVHDAARIFGVSRRTIQQQVRNRKLRARDLPGRGRFLSEDLELFLSQSIRNQKRTGVEGQGLKGNNKPTEAKLGSLW